MEPLKFQSQIIPGKSYFLKSKLSIFLTLVLKETSFLCLLLVVNFGSQNGLGMPNGLTIVFSFSLSITLYSLANVGYFLWRHLILKLSLSICRERARKKKEEEERRIEREREKVFSQLSFLPYCYLGARLFHWFSNKQILKFETVYIDCGS
jgi:hypothetical protein